MMGRWKKNKQTEFEMQLVCLSIFHLLIGLISPYLNLESFPKTSITTVFILLLLCKQVCSGMVMDIVYSSSGFLHDAKVFANSKFSTRMTDKELPVT